ncbi:MAG: hypothetical protein K8I65_07390 [Thermoanaerobaculia bacterium]|nr:hypothetical protein [Thermoanaerobaculia bacterium]
MRGLRSSLLAAAALVAAAGPAAADWLVMKDGSRLETRGAWKVDGRRVVFNLPNGTLSAIRADEIDLDASAAATARAVEAAQAAAAPAPPPRPLGEPILRLTEKDIPPMSGAADEDAPAAEGEGEEEEKVTGLQVAHWEKVQAAGGEGVEIFGSIRNGGTVHVTSPSVMVMIYGEDGGLLATNEGTINGGAIAPGGSVNFRVAFPGLPDFTSAKFDVQGRGFQTRPPAGTDPAEPVDEPTDGVPAGGEY